MAPQPLPELVRDVIVEILLRLPPDEPGHLFRAALVCKPWLRIICDARFRLRYHTLHGAPPFLGFVHKLFVKARAEIPPARSSSEPSLLNRLYKFVKGDTSACTAPPSKGGLLVMPKLPELSDRWAFTTLDCRHGRVLVSYTNLDGGGDYYVWDPVMGDRYDLPQPPPAPYRSWIDYSSTVLCAADGCNHIDCHGTPFRVILVSTHKVKDDILARVYSSETRTWSKPPTTDVTHPDFSWRPFLEPIRPALVRGAIYFPSYRGNTIFKFDLDRDSFSRLDPPPTNSLHFALMPIESTSLGFASVEGSCLYVWSKKVDTGDLEDWVLYSVTELRNSIPSSGPDDIPFVVGFAEGVDVIFLTTPRALHMISISSGEIKKLDDTGHLQGVLPYLSFYMPGVPRGKQSMNMIAQQAPKPQEEAPQQKPKNPLDLLPPSKMALDDWKSLYSDTKSNFHEVAVKGLWEMYDPEGYSLWFCEYKYQDENIVSHMTLNKVLGFLQRMDPCRKYAFGKMLVIGSEAPFEIKGLWLFRGQDIPKFVMDGVHDMELYEWTKVDISDKAQKERVNAMIEDLEPFEGQALLYSQCFK